MRKNQRALRAALKDAAAKERAAARDEHLLNKRAHGQRFWPETWGDYCSASAAHGRAARELTRLALELTARKGPDAVATAWLALGVPRNQFAAVEHPQRAALLAAFGRTPGHRSHSLGCPFCGA
jgi:hypothetical protein